MSARLVLLPGPEDRLDPIAAALRWWTTRLAAVFADARAKIVSLEDLEQGAGRLPRSALISLPADEIFLSRVTLPPGRSEAHRKALALRLADLAPLDPSTLEIAARSGRREEAGAVVYVVGMARADRLAALEAAARGRGARQVAFCSATDPGVRLDTARARDLRRRGLLIDGGLVLVLIVAAVLASNAATQRLEDETRALLAADQESRRAAVAEARAAQEAALADVLVAQGVLDRRAGTVLEDLAALNAATPDSVWWTRLRWAPGDVLIAGEGAEASSAIERLSAAAAATGWSVAPAGAVQSSGAGPLQTFELRAVKREVSVD